MSTKRQVLKIIKHIDTTQILIKIISRNPGMKATWQGHAFIEFVTKSQLLGQIPALWHIFFAVGAKRSRAVRPSVN